MLSNTTYPNTGYTHQGSLSKNHKFFFFGDETDELLRGTRTKTLVLDVRNLISPRIAGFHLGSSRATDHNQYVSEGLIYQTNYRAGLRILRIIDAARANLKEVAMFDIFPDSDSPDFNGAWSNYLFPSSGTLLVSGVEQGLYVLKATWSPEDSCPVGTERCLPFRDRVSGSLSLEDFQDLFLGSDEEESELETDGCSTKSLFPGFQMHFDIFASLCTSMCVRPGNVASLRRLGWECGPCDEE
jgi:hypothetical protein